MRKVGVIMNGEEIYQVGIYIRLSKEVGDDGESESVENQRDLIKNFIEEHEDLEFVEEYVDDRIYTGLTLTDLILKE